MANISTPSMQELLEAGVHFGHKVSRGHPRMKPYIYGARDGIHILDLAKSEEMLKVAVEKAYELGKNGGTMLLVGTKKQAREMIKALAEESNSPYLVQKWVGGLFTNFEAIRRNMDSVLTEKRQQDTGEVQRTKKEQLLFSRKLEKFQLELGGVVDMKKLPDAIFVVDAVSDASAVKEAMATKVKIFGFSDTNANPDIMDYPVAANDDGIKSIKIVSEAVINAYNKGRKEAGEKVLADKAAEEAKAAEVAVEPLLAEVEVLEEVAEKEAVKDAERTNA